MCTLMRRRMKLNKVVGIVFDLDGTLLDSVDVHVESWIEAFEGHGVRKVSRDELYRMIGFLAK